MRAWTGFLLAWFVALASRRSRVAADDGRLRRRPWPSPHRRDQDGRLSRTRPKVFRTGCTFALCLAAAVGAQPGRLHRRRLAISVGRQRKQGGEREIAPVRQARMEPERHAGLEGRKAARPEIVQQDRRPIAVVERPRFRPQAQAEIELVTATDDAITALGFTGFTVRINDRQILLALAEICGFPSGSFGSVFITLDKLDKVGLDGVRAELESKEFPAEAIQRVMATLTGFTQDRGDFAATRAALPEGIPAGPLDRLERIIAVVGSQAAGRFSLVFDPTLVRGMGYYTGNIFEIEAPGYSGSIAGGGRYDRMVGKLLGRDMPASGFSIGFERLMQILEERGYTPPMSSQKLAFLFDAETDDLTAALAAAATLREQGYVVNMLPRQKKMRRQLDELSTQGYTLMTLYRPDDALPEVKPLEGH